jgi:hypothetical protein
MERITVPNQQGQNQYETFISKEKAGSVDVYLSSQLWQEV